MRKFKWPGLFFILLLAVAMLISGCGASTTGTDDNSAASEKTTIRIGASADAIPLAESGKEALEALGYAVEVVSFDDFFTPNVALDEGSIDVNFYQHKVFLDNYNQEKGTNIVMIDPSMYNYFLGLYTQGGVPVDQLPDGGKIGIANDAANIDQFLRVMDKWGVITLTDEAKDLYAVTDIVGNPKNYEFIQLDYNQRCSAYSGGELAAMVCASNTLFMAGLNPTENLIESEVDNNYALGLCINGNTANADEKWVKDVMSAYTSDSACQYVMDYYKDAYRYSEGLDQLKNE